ncbi:hypothetical protein CTM86_06250 [Fusobacterium pseudoperiodonticum]|uniref:GmrSD restriction endonucleases N-terminal domain-containing protein n=1 Tax=Fusobacterium pseudoperiodonticum TaxID=2663009 RepID=A0AAD0AS85_9FUSO|nr:DUF262 domain-containing protein [Fusobacterium pseudoperiodonticum]ATV66226.1 hypothetical protein CTM86_06250 [Fusobacterium pseudoperiodonticum]
MTKEISIATRNVDKTIININEDIKKGFRLQEISSSELEDSEPMDYLDALIVSPDYQREYRYSLANESSIIESILVGIPIPPIFIAKNRVNNVHVLNVIDGQHRLRAINRFLENQYSLTGLTLLPEYEGKYYNDFSNEEKMLLNSKKISFIEFENFPGLKIEIEIFSRYNKGTKPLTAQEIRHAVYNSRFNEYVNNFVNTFKNIKDSIINKIYNMTNDRILKKKIHESIFVIMYILENGINTKLEKSPDYAEEFMKEKKEISMKDEKLFEENFQKIKKNFENFNEFMKKVGEVVSYPFSKEIYGIASRNYKFQISIAMILSAIYNKTLLENKEIDVSKFLPEIKSKLEDSFLEAGDYNSSSTNSKKIQEFIETIELDKFFK